MCNSKAALLNCGGSFLFPVFYGGGNCSMLSAAKGQSCLYELLVCCWPVAFGSKLRIDINSI